MRTFVSHGITPIATFYLGNVGPDVAAHAEQIVVHSHTHELMVHTPIGRMSHRYAHNPTEREAAESR
jgi:hypothetical protein